MNLNEECGMKSAFSEYQGMEGTMVTRSSLTVTKLSCNATCIVVKAMAKPNQRSTVILEAARGRSGRGVCLSRVDRG